MDQDDWDDKVPAVLWAYRTTYKKSSSHTPFKMVYGQEAIIPLQFKHQAPEIAKVLKLNLSKAKEYMLFHIQNLEEDIFNSIHHREVQNK